MSFRRDDLYIQEEILLLALKDEKGTFYMRTILPALGGAIAAELLLAGKIEVEQDRKRYPELDHGAEQLLTGRLHDAIFGESMEIEPRTVVLMALARATDLLSIPFPRKELNSRKKRIKSIVEGDLIGTATKEAVEAVNAAIMIAAIVPIIAASSVSSS